jgi:3-oxoadipate enol-lactonase
MPYVTVNGVNMHYKAQGTGPAVLLLHGLGSCAEDWSLQFPALGARYTALALDLRGHGHTDKPAAPYTIAQLADDVSGLLDTLGIGAVHVVGLSLGGLVAQTLAAGRPQAVRSLVLANTFARLRPRRWQEVSYLLNRGWALLTGGLEKQVEFVARGLFPHPEQEELRRIAVERLGANDPAAYRVAIWAALRFDGRPSLARIRVPTLVVAGADDTTVALAHKERLAAGIAGARLVVIPNSGHASPIDQSERFNRLLLDFVDEVESRDWRAG